MSQDPFFTRLFAAQDAGLSREWCAKVAFGFCTLEEALGDMDMDGESLPWVGADLAAHEGHDCGCRVEASCKDCIPF